MRTTPNIKSEMDRARRERGEAFTGPSADAAPDQGKTPGVAAVAAGSGSVPASELRNLAITWRSHAFTAPADMQLALDSCAMDLDRLAESYDPREPRPNSDYHAQAQITKAASK